MWEIETALVQEWLMSLSEDDYDLVFAALGVLAAEGPMLGRPLVDTVGHSRHKNMKELRPGSTGRTEIRLLFAFDPRRKAILLVAGDKAGAWSSWYAKNVPIADQRFDDHLQELSRPMPIRSSRSGMNGPARSRRRKKP